ncbi:hypothetical protein GCM10027575_48750 [Phytohabitans suffuscus]
MRANLRNRRRPVLSSAYSKRATRGAVIAGLRVNGIRTYPIAAPDCVSAGASRRYGFVWDPPTRPAAA